MRLWLVTGSWAERPEPETAGDGIPAPRCRLDAPEARPATNAPGTAREAGGARERAQARRGGARRPDAEPRQGPADADRESVPGHERPGEQWLERKVSGWQLGRGTAREGGRASRPPGLPPDGAERRGSGPAGSGPVDQEMRHGVLMQGFLRVTRARRPLSY